MKYLYTLILLGLFNITFAQLSVQNSAYVYVTDEILFVTDDVNIDDAASRIYIRNEAQLIQGTGITGNSGLGQLSIRQRGTVNQYTYNYWCSPVGNNSALFGNENFQIGQINESTGLTTSINAVFTGSYDATANPFRPSNRWLFTFEISDEYSEWVYVNTTNNIKPGLGFTMKGISGTNATNIGNGNTLNPGNNQLYDFRGKPNNGTISSDIASEQQTLIGNPYPSALDALLFIHDPLNTTIGDATALSPTTTGALLFWEQQAGQSSHDLDQYIGGYAHYTISAGGVETFVNATFNTFDNAGNPISLPPGPGGVKVVKRYLPIGQGFMVEGETGIPINSKVYMTNAQRVYQKESGGNSYFFRNNANNLISLEPRSENNNIVYNDIGLNVVPDDFMRFRLNIDFNNLYTRQLVHNFHITATDGFDYGLEAKINDLLVSDATWTFNEQPFVIQAHNYDISLKIPIAIKSDIDQPIQFRSFDIQNFAENQPIYLHDIETNVYVDLRTQNYNTNITQGNYDSRFEITFTDEALYLDSYDSKDFEIFQNNSTSELSIFNPNSLRINSIALYDISGKQIFNHINLGMNTEYHFSTKNLSTGVYAAIVESNNKRALSKKVIIEN